RIVVFLPPFDLARGNVTLVVVFRVSSPAVSLGFNEDGATTLSRIVCCPPGYFVTGHHIIAINDRRRDVVTGGFLSQVSNGCLQTRRSGVGVVVVFCNHDERQLLDSGKV